MSARNNFCLVFEIGNVTCSLYYIWNVHVTQACFCDMRTLSSRVVKTIALTCWYLWQNKAVAVQICYFSIMAGCVVCVYYLVTVNKPHQGVFVINQYTYASHASIRDKSVSNSLYAATSILHWGYFMAMNCREKWHRKRSCQALVCTFCDLMLAEHLTFSQANPNRLWWINGCNCPCSLMYDATHTVSVRFYWLIIIAYGSQWPTDIETIDAIC